MNANADQFKGWRDAEYKGPKGLADDQSGWNQYWGAAQNANTTAKLAGKESGRFALLDKYYGRPAYNFGEKSLDNLLIQRGGGLNDVKSIQDKAAGLNTYGANQSKELSATAAQRAGQVEQTRNAARSAVGLGANGQVQGGALGGMESDINARAGKWNTDRDNTYNGITADLADDQVSDETLRALGLTGGENLYGLDLRDSRYLTKNPQNATAANIASGDDYNRYLALSKLAGIDPTFLSEANRGQAGTAGSKVGFNKDLFEQDRLSSDAALKAAAAPAQQKYDKANNDYQATLRMAQDDPGQRDNLLRLAEVQKSELNQALKELDAKRNEMQGNRRLNRATASIVKPKLIGRGEGR